jgi:hypothetical protein
MAKQRATNGHEPETLPALDLTYGFPGKLPRNIRHTQFIQAYVQCGEIRTAAKACGYSQPWAQVHAPKVLKDYHDFVAWLQAQRAQAVVQTIGIEQERVLEEMARIGFANEYDYLVFYEKDEQDANRKRTGKKVPWARRKYVHELTREQLTAVIVFRRGSLGSLDWKWRDRDQMLQLIAKNVGLLNDKIIMEHRHRHLHMNFDLSKVTMQDLEALEGQFEVLLGQGGATK